MIRVNLLRNRKEGLQRLMAEPRGASTFVSGREVLLAALFLALGGAILWFVLGHPGAPDPAVAAGTVETSSSQSGGETVATPTEVAVGREAAPVVQSTPLGSSPPPSPAPAASRPSAAGPVNPRGSTLLSQRSSTALAPAAPSTATPAAGFSGSGGVITMSALRILGEGDNLQILAATDGRPEYKMFRVDNPDRVVIDLAGVRHEISRENREQLLSNSIVKEVRVAQNQIEPPMVRLVLVVESFPELQILPRPDGLLINVTAK
jgi:hypothetical protein